MLPPPVKRHEAASKEQDMQLHAPPERPRFRGRAAALLLVAAAGSGCGLMDAPGTPMIVSHRAAAGRAPENSRSAVAAALAAGDAALEVDLVLTSDQQPILSHDAYLSPELCTNVDGTALDPGTKLLIKDLTLAQIQEGFRCGGLEDPGTPGAALFADSIMTLDELLEAVRPHPGVTLQLDIKQEPEQTLDEDTYAAVILARWNAAALQNPMFITATHPATLRAFEARADVTTLRIWPIFPDGGNTTLIGLGNELTRVLGFQELVQLTREADADGIAVAFQVSDRAALETVRQAGLKTALWTANKESELATFCNWPLDYLITDYPERAPCR